MSTGPGRDHVGKSSCLTGSICFQLLCICMALAGRPPQPCCTCGGFRCICIDIAVVEDSLAELDLYPPPCLFGMLGICKAVSTFFDCLSRSAGPSKRKEKTNKKGCNLVVHFSGECPFLVNSHQMHGLLKQCFLHSTKTIFTGTRLDRRGLNS